MPLFKKFGTDFISSQSLVKSSVARAIRADILKEFRNMGDLIDRLLPKKSPITLLKCHNHIKVVTVNQEILFFNVRDGPWYPTLRVLHEHPEILPRFVVDRGATKYMLGGANIMCPGLTSVTGEMEDVPAETVVGIYVSGKENAAAVGITKMSTEDIRSINKNVAVENMHHLNDGLWVEPDVF